MNPPKEWKCFMLQEVAEQFWTRLSSKHVKASAKLVRYWRKEVEPR